MITSESQKKYTNLVEGAKRSGCDEHRRRKEEEARLEESLQRRREAEGRDRLEAIFPEILTQVERVCADRLWTPTPLMVVLPHEYRYETTIEAGKKLPATDSKHLEFAARAVFDALKNAGLDVQLQWRRDAGARESAHRLHIVMYPPRN